MSEAGGRAASEAAIEPVWSRADPGATLVFAIVGAVFLGFAFSTAPDGRDLAALARSTSRVESREVSCTRRGHGPNATIILGGRYFTCPGVDCDRGGPSGVPRWVRYDPNDPRRCRAEEGLGGATSWETQTMVIFGAGGVGALLALGVMTARVLRRRAAVRDFYASKEWKDYVVGRDGEP